jgi:hypothetical protein
LKSGPKKVLPISLADFGAAETGSESGSSSESEIEKKPLYLSFYEINLR